MGSAIISYKVSDADYPEGWDAFLRRMHAEYEKELRKMERKDDRTKEQRKTHYWGIVATDKFLSGWGHAKGGLSKCCWACDSIDTAERVERHVRNRSEMRYINIVDLRTYKPRNCVHWYVYVVDVDHPYAK